MGLYVTTPILVPLAWWANRRTDPGTPEPGESRLPASVRDVLLGVGAVQTLVALVLLLSPSTMIDAWPWMLTPLTAQTLGGWFALPGITGDHDGPRRPPERDPDHAAQPGHRPRADPRRGRRATGAASTADNALSYVFVARPRRRCSPGCSRSSCTCAAARASRAGLIAAGRASRPQARRGGARRGRGRRTTSSGGQSIAPRAARSIAKPCSADQTSSAFWTPASASSAGSHARRQRREAVEARAALDLLRQRRARAGGGPRTGPRRARAARRRSAGRRGPSPRAPRAGRRARRRRSGARR